MFEYDINSFEEYIDLLQQYQEKYPEEIWYRGHKNCKWKLEPNLFRNKKMNLKGSEVSMLNYDFPNFEKEFQEICKKMESDNLFERKSLNNMQLMFLAQHYGLLTPILDWTLDPLIALFFAIDEFEEVDDKYPIIYIMRPRICNSNTYVVQQDGEGNMYSIEKPICIDGITGEKYWEYVKGIGNCRYHIPVAFCTEKNFSYRITRQSGCFTLHSPIQPFNYQWNDITIKGSKLVDSWTINPNTVKKIQGVLKVLRVNSDTIYIKDNDELDNAAKEIKENCLREYS